GASLPMSCSQWGDRCVRMPDRSARSCGTAVTGIVKSAAAPTTTPPNSGGVTPMIVTASPLTRKLLPITPGSAANACVQKLWLSTATRACALFVRPGHAALADAGALADPLIRGVEDLRELVVGHHALGRVATGPLELRDRALHRAALPPASSAPMS